jgi:anaerobic dimethyl sulfoxide reductase subunit B (iron-sulfur subunit)
MVLHFDPMKCTGCCACQMACLDQRDISGKPLRYVRFREETGLYDSVGCTHCGACSQICPQGCMQRDALGFVLLNQAGCIGCGSCESVCPNSVISRDPSTGKAIKCDGCTFRIQAGLLPACVHTCPTGALTLE